MKSNLPVTQNEVHLTEATLIVSRTDLKGRITYVNKDFVEISGFAESELLGEPHNVVRHPDMPEEAFADLWQTLQAGRPWQGYVKNRCKNGDFYWVEAHAAPEWEGDQIVGYISVRRKPAREKIQQAEAAYRLFVNRQQGKLRIKDGWVHSTNLWSRTKGGFQRQSIATKMMLGSALIVLTIMSTLSVALGDKLSQALDTKGLKDLQQNLQLVKGMVEIKSAASRREVERLNKLFTASFSEGFSLAGSPDNPLLRSGKNTLNDRPEDVDRFTQEAGAVATLFVKRGDDFLRVATSLKKPSGERAIGTVLDRQHPAYAKLIAGGEFVGRARLFEKDYLTSYAPIKSSDGSVIGATFVGIDISSEIADLTKHIKAIKIGDSGYFYVLDATPGPSRGTLVVHPAKEGANILDEKDSSGHQFIREMLDTQRGEIRYPWANVELGESNPREKIVMFDTVPEWNWTIAGGTYLEEFRAASRSLGYYIWLATLLVVVVLVVLMHFLIKKLIRQPLTDQILPAFRALSGGKYDSKLDLGRTDEIGQVIQGLETMQNRLGFEVAETNRQANEIARIKVALDNVSTPVRMADPAGLVIYANKAMTDTLRRIEPNLKAQNPNFSVVGFVGSSIGTLYADPKAALARLSALTQTAETEMEIGGRHYRVLTSPVMNAKGERLGSVGEWLDRTEQLAIEKEIDAIVSAARQGDLDQRIATAGKSGFFLALAEGFNGFLATTQGALRGTSHILSKVARGDLSDTLDGDYAGIFGELMININTTIEQLRAVVGQIKESSEAINTAAKEISAGNQDLSSRTESQASNLEESSSAMEQLNATVGHNAESAQKANELATNSLDTVQQGGDLVRQLVDTMSGIQASSRKIGEIVGLIDSIAFQTNILALNAAVEAARAGEQGRGFAVVATEVRNLAQRSAMAAKEIKELISDSVNRVDRGAQLVESTGSNMDEIVGRFRQVAGLLTDITNATREQSNGIEQVTLAVSQMDEITQQNAALVEEAAAAAESLEEQANGLVRVVGQFRLSAADGNQIRMLPSDQLVDIQNRQNKSAVTQSSNPIGKVSRLTIKSQPSSHSEDEWEEF